MEKEILHLQQLSPKGNINTDGYTEAIDYALKIWKYVMLLYLEHTDREKAAL